MKSRLLLGTILAAFVSIGAARADLILTLGTSNDLGNSGPGPYGTVNLSLVNPTTANFTFTAAAGFSFGDMGLNINATNFSSSAVTFAALATDTQTPSYTTLINGSGGQSQLDGFGNFTLVQNDQPNGFSSSVTSASFTITDLSGTWANINQVLVDNASGNEAAIHAFNITNGGNSFYAADSGTPRCVGTGCTPPGDDDGTPRTNTPEPLSLALLGTALVGLGMTRWARRL